MAEGRNRRRKEGGIINQLGLNWVGSGLHDAYVEDSIVSRLVSIEVQNEHMVKCYIGFFAGGIQAYQRTMRMDMRGRIELGQRVIARMRRKTEHCVVWLSW
jgi:hypothetical protein